MIARQVKRFLDEHRVRYTTVTHSPAYTAQELAAAAHVHGDQVAKTVVVRADGALAMVVLPATRRIDFERLAHAIGATQVHLADEADFVARFPACEPGAMPPFGNLYGMQVYVDSALAAHAHIVFNAGTHTELVRMAFPDFNWLVSPKILPLSELELV